MTKKKYYTPSDQMAEVGEMGNRLQENSSDNILPFMQKRKVK